MLMICSIVFTDIYCTAHLDMGWNKLTGSIPESMIALPLSKCLHFLFRSTGLYSSSLSQSCTLVESIRLSRNDLTGVLPAGFWRDRANWYVLFRSLVRCHLTRTLLNFVVDCMDIRSTKVTGSISNRVCSAQNNTTSLYIPCEVLCLPDTCCSCDEAASSDACRTSPLNI
jgi:hypothetical protein